ncbi:MAG: DEAD/DEAH box helicase [Candidatus Aenigmatarchaeota archaeon]
MDSDPVEIVKTRSKIEEFNPVQKLALEKGLIEGKSQVVSSPTASGKTIIGELAVMSTFLKKKGKSIYIVPLKALASEKYHDFREKYEDLGLKVGVSTGDLDSASNYLEKKDLLILTSEKLDSLIRHKAGWLDDISLIVADETHLLTDPYRGPTLEIVLTLLKNRLNPQIIALSATISNSYELAEWLEAELVESDYRPVPLKQGIFIPGQIVFSEENMDVECQTTHDLIRNVLSKGRQALIFFASRRNAESFAEKLALELPPTDPEISQKVLKALGSPTRQCKREAACLRHGVAFHHAGLANSQRLLIERGFRENKIKVICATTTLAAGLNLPAFLVIVRDITRYSGGRVQYIPNLEIQQMLGRAGRPKYDKKGIALLLAKDRDAAYELRSRYLLGDIEPIFSKISMEPVLRVQVLSLIAGEFARSREKLVEIFSRTFFGFMFGASFEFQDLIEKVLGELEGFGFLDTEEFRATKVGKRVAELYVDPLSANRLISALAKIGPGTDEFFLLQLIASCSELQPLLRVSGKEFAEMDDFIFRNKERFITTVPTQWDYDYELFIQSIKTAKMLLDWASEKTEDEILDRYGVTPGEVYTKTTNSGWLLYAAGEFARLKDLSRVAEEFRRLELRVTKGIRGELLELISIKGIGRVKARRLYNMGLRKFSDFKKFDRAALGRAVGKTTLEKILAENKESW